MACWTANSAQKSPKHADTRRSFREVGWFLPTSSTQSNMDSSPEPLQDVMWVLFRCFGANSLSLPGSPGDLWAKEVLLLHNLRFWNGSSPPTMGGVVVVVVVVPVSIALLLAWKCMCAAIPPRKMKDGEDATTDRSPPKSHVLSSSCCYSIHLDIQDTLFCTSELPQRRSDPSLRLPQEAYHLPSGFIFLRWVA